MLLIDSFNRRRRRRRYPFPSLQKALWALPGYAHLRHALPSRRRYRSRQLPLSHYGSITQLLDKKTTKKEKFQGEILFFLS